MENNESTIVDELTNDSATGSADKEKVCRFDSSVFNELKDEMAMLRDLFTRRLMEDKQKTELIRNLEESSKFAFIEPFLYDLILLLDRIEESEDEMMQSVYEELSDILYRRGVSKIELTDQFDPKTNKVVRIEKDETLEKPIIRSVIRQGYMFSGRVIRPTEIIIAKPSK